LTSCRPGRTRPSSVPSRLRPEHARPPRSDRSPAERAEAGKAAREAAPRTSHGEWAPAADRPDPVELLEGQATSRVGQLLPLRYGRMLVSPFTFYRGAAAVMAADLASTRAWVVLLQGRDEGDPLFLQVKEAQPSVLEPYAEPTVFAQQGERVVQGQRLVQAASDIMLGWVRAKGVDDEKRDYYVRQLWDQKGSARVENMDPRALTAYAQICGTTLAHAHARSGDRIAIAGYLGKGDTFDQAIAAFAETYADQNERDYEALRPPLTTGG